MWNSVIGRQERLQHAKYLSPRGKVQFGSSAAECVLEDTEQVRKVGLKAQGRMKAPFPSLNLNLFL